MTYVDEAVTFIFSPSCVFSWYILLSKSSDRNLSDAVDALLVIMLAPSVLWMFLFRKFRYNKNMLRHITSLTLVLCTSIILLCSGM